MPRLARRIRTLGPPACANELEIYFVIDTGYAWLTSDVEVDYTATDGGVDFTCLTSSSHAGWVACYGYKAAASDPLEFCMQRRLDAQPVCQTFNSFPDALAELICFVPSPLPPPPSPCYAITDITTCMGKAACTWDSPNNRCVPKP